MPEGGRLAVSLRPAPEESRLVDSSISQSGKTEVSIRGDQLTNPPFDESTAPPGAEEWVEIRFQDTGRGIPQDELKRIFDPFYTTRASGTGLGLAIARKSLESMGGRIDVVSRPSSGTTFRLWLRRAPVDVNDQIPMTNDQPRLGVRP
jgi:signal transduction histidine kinase